MALGGQKVAELALGDEQRGQDRSFRNWTKMTLMGLCDAFDIEMPRQVEEKWPFSRSRVRKASWMPHSFRTTNNIDGNFFFCQPYAMPPHPPCPWKKISMKYFFILS